MIEQTWFATVVCVIAVIPGFIVGGLMKMLTYVFGGWANGSDFLYLRAIFGIETPGEIYEWIFAHAIPSGLQALVAGFVAVWVMEKIARGAHYALAATITGALYTGFLICLVVIGFAQVGITGDMLLGICQGIGLWIGLGSAAASLPVPRSATA